MTREEAKRFWLIRYENAKDFSDPHWEAQERREHREYVEALRMAIEALQAEPNKAVAQILADMYKRERDIALSQLEEYGIGFGEKKRDDLVEVVRCKDCKASRVYGKTRQWLACEEDAMEGQATDPDGYCYLGERKEE